MVVEGRTPKKVTPTLLHQKSSLPQKYATSIYIPAAFLARLFLSALQRVPAHHSALTASSLPGPSSAATSSFWPGSSSCPSSPWPWPWPPWPSPSPPPPATPPPLASAAIAPSPPPAPRLETHRARHQQLERVKLAAAGGRQAAESWQNAVTTQLVCVGLRRALCSPQSSGVPKAPDGVHSSISSSS